MPLVRHRPSALTGFARTLDVGGTFGRFRIDDTPAIADRRALTEDFSAVAEDFVESVRIIAADS